MIYGGAGNDVIDAGGGTSAQYQYLYGSIGDDTYVYSKENLYVYIGSAARGRRHRNGGSGQVHRPVAERPDASTNYLYTGASAAEGNALNFTWDNGASTGQLRIALGAQHIERFEFADGTTLSAISYDTASGATTLTGTAGNDLIRAGNGYDAIYGGTGNDVMDAGAGATAYFQYLYGQAGDDTYVYSKENVYVYIGSAAEGAATGTADRVKFTDLSLKDLTLSNYLYTGDSAAEGNAFNFTWSEGASTGQLRIALGAQHIERFEFADGTTLSAISYNAANGYAALTGTAGNDTITGGSGKEYVYGGAGNDILDAGAGAGWQYLMGQPATTPMSTPSRAVTSCCSAPRRALRAAPTGSY